MVLTQQLTDKLNTKPMWNQKDLLQQVGSFENHLQNLLENKGRLIKMHAQKFVKPSVIKVGDVISVRLVGMPHPAIVWKVKDNICYCITMSTTEAQHNIYRLEHSRLFESFVTKTITEVTMEEALKSFVTKFDSRKELKIIFDLVRAYYKNLTK